MFNTKYAELKEAYREMKESYNAYESTCRHFIERLQRRLVKHLDCSEEKVKWIQIEEEDPPNEHILRRTFGERMVLFDDTFYLFVFLIRFGDSEWVQVPLRVKKQDKLFIVKVQGDKQEVNQDTEDLDALVECIFNSVKEYLETDFDNFVRGVSARSIGFKTS